LFEIQAVHFYQVFQNFLFLCLLTILFSGSTGAADSLPERFLKLDGEIVQDGDRIEINWSKASGSNIDPVIIQRRVLGQTDKESWQKIASVKGIKRFYIDKQVQPGIAYEYRVSRASQKKIETGYWATGRDLPAEEKRGIALVVVDETLAEDLAPRLDRFMLDLVGDGWTVVRRDVPRGDDKNAAVNLKAAQKLRTWIQDRYNANWLTPHALILIGRIPVVKSGRANPDGHNRRPLETDLFYADTNGVWLDNGNGILRHNAIPSDHIEMQVGRIDFSNLDSTLGDEVFLLKNYFDKNHHWRHGHLGDLRQAYGGNKNLSGEINALRNIVGPKDFKKGGHHDVGTQQPWLFGVDFGNWKYEKYTSSNPIKTVFSINFGSNKLNFSRWNNTMTAMLAQRWYGLATGWGGRPAWQLHHMALGKSIGYSHLRTVNNGARSKGGVETLEYTPTGEYPWVNPIWVNLLGDPTLRPFPVEPVKNLRAEVIEDGIQISWAEVDTQAAVQYRVYRALDRFGPYQALNPSELHSGNRYVDSNPVPGSWYMVRAHSLKEVNAGSFFAFSQGAFATVGNVPPRARDQLISIPMGQRVTINLAEKDPDSGNLLTTAFVKDPEVGRLSQTDGKWSFFPGTEFTGCVNIPFTIFDGISSDYGLVSIDITEP
jgi:hypothetical protein